MRWLSSVRICAGRVLCPTAPPAVKRLCGCQTLTCLNLRFRALLWQLPCLALPSCATLALVRRAAAVSVVVAVAVSVAVSDAATVTVASKTTAFVGVLNPICVGLLALCWLCGLLALCWLAVVSLLLRIKRFSA